MDLSQMAEVVASVERKYLTNSGQWQISEYIEAFLYAGK